MKRIAIFCDGTWNTPDKSENGILCPTNVVKMANALSPFSKDGTKQLLYYDTGIGSAGGVFARVFDGATGTGISGKILQAYKFIIQNYEPGDELFLFGFSRGAFTVRSLAGLVRNSGILKIENIDLVPRAFSIYHSRKAKYQPREVEATLFRKTYAVEETTRIKFIGVWDTVGALGNPLFLSSWLSRKNQFHDTTLSTRVDFAYHALAVDEKRKNFEATLWHQQADAKNQVLEQVWFPGVHSDVGGGYPETEDNLSDIALQWMLGKANACNLNFETIGIKADPKGAIHESFVSFYKFQSKFFRPIDAPDQGTGKTNESLHPMVMERYDNFKTYRPKNLLDFLKRK
jgi:uncharacterized protein (DUF2235 family)